MNSQDELLSNREARWDKLVREFGEDVVRAYIAERAIRYVTDVSRSDLARFAAEMRVDPVYVAAAEMEHNERVATRNRNARELFDEVKASLAPGEELAFVEGVED